MSNECMELKTIKYKSMLISGNSEVPKETVENMSNLDMFLAGEKQNNSNEPWIKLDKTTKILKFNEFTASYCEDNDLSEKERNEMKSFLQTHLDRRRLLKAKEVVYNKDTGKIQSIPSLIYVPSTKKFTLKRCEKRQSTLKSLAPKRIKKKPVIENSVTSTDNTDKIDINN